MGVSGMITLRTRPWLLRDYCTDHPSHHRSFTRSPSQDEVPERGVGRGYSVYPGKDSGLDPRRWSPPLT